MGHVADEIRVAIEKSGARARVLDGLGATVLAQLEARYARPGRSEELWDRLEDSAGYRDPEGWRWIAKCVSGHESICAFPTKIERAAIVFDDGAELGAVLEQCSGFEFYVTDPAYTFVLCFNHHDFVVAAGAAKQWLESRHRLR